jgi:hypothetical protein
VEWGVVVDGEHGRRHRQSERNGRNDRESRVVYLGQKVDGYACTNSVGRSRTEQKAKLAIAALPRARILLRRLLGIRLLRILLRILLRVRLLLGILLGILLRVRLLLGIRLLLRVRLLLGIRLLLRVRLLLGIRLLGIRLLGIRLLGPSVSAEADGERGRYSDRKESLCTPTKERPFHEAPHRAT